MNREDKYLLGCLYAVDKWVKKGSKSYMVKIDGEWEEIPWSEIIEWINKQYGIEESEV